MEWNLKWLSKGSQIKPSQEFSMKIRYIVDVTDLQFVVIMCL